MSYFQNKNKLLIWLVIILLATNVGTILSFYFLQQNREMEFPPEPINRQNVPYKKDKFAHFLKDKLNLSTEQDQKFGILRDKFHGRAEVIMGEIHQKRKLLYKELAKEKINEAQLDTIAQEIGNLHTNLKKISIEHYLEMRKVCTSEQQTILYELFKNTFEEEQHKNRGKHKRNRFGN